MADVVMAVHGWATNGHLIADAAKLDYIYGKVLDPTHGLGTFWTRHRPEHLIASDIDPKKSPLGESVDFTDMPYGDGSFDTVVFDPPYKLNGRPSAAEERYGVHKLTRWQDRMELIRLGVIECARVTRDMLLVKCQDQVCSGQMVWQTDLVTEIALDAGMRKVDRFDFMSYRAQPAGRTQKHARHNASQLLVFSYDRARR